MGAGYLRRQPDIITFELFQGDLQAGAGASAAGNLITDVDEAEAAAEGYGEDGKAKQKGCATIQE